jgi:hypothetical protein
MTIKFFLFLLIAFFFIRFVLRFLLPVFKLTKMTHSHLNNLREKVDHLQQNQHQQPKSRPQAKVDGEYIEYEEVK